MKKSKGDFNNCLYRELPFCAGACPFGYDVTEFVQRITQGNYASAFRIYRDAVAFPRIVSALCPQPCKGACPRQQVDTAIELGAIERAVIELSADTAPNKYAMPSRGKRVAVIGSGLGGLGCALRLASMKYSVEVFEAGSIIGASTAELVGREIFERDVEEQFRFEGVSFHTDSAVSAADAAEKLGFDAVYDASRRVASPDNISGNNDTDGGEEIYALARGLSASGEIDGYLRTGLCNGKTPDTSIWTDSGKTETADAPPCAKGTDMVLHELRLRAASEVPIAAAFREAETVPGKSAKYHLAGTYGSTDDTPRIIKGATNKTALSLQKEAARCLLCKCDACRSFCDLTDYYGKWPLRIRDEVVATTLPGSAEVKATPAKRLMSTCNLCGVCRDVCPIDIDMGTLILEGRRSMHKQEKAPWVFHDFWLQDMAHANSDEARMARMPWDTTEAPLAFFPGCQLCAEAPELVLRAYRALSSIFPDIGILTRCCGAPAEWSGDEDTHKASLQEFAADWEAMGRPLLLAACPTCVKEIGEHLPDVPVSTVYEKLAEYYAENDPENLSGLMPRASNKLLDTSWAIFDPCSAGASLELKAAVRTLAAGAGAQLETLPIQDEVARCCGYGGQPGVANPDYAKFVAKKRACERDVPYLTYCINCREAFAREGKRTAHILELLFPESETQPGAKELSEPPTVTQRRLNRIIMKKSVLKGLWGEDMETKTNDYEFDLIIGDELSKKLDSRRMLEDEAYETVAFALKSGRYVVDAETGTKSAYHKIGHMTFWVTFDDASAAGNDPTATAGQTSNYATELPARPSIILLNAYSHRMAIELEPVWNGVKVEIEE